MKTPGPKASADAASRPADGRSGLSNRGLGALLGLFVAAWFVLGTAWAVYRPTLEGVVAWLPEVNALCNAVAAVLLVVAYRRIRRRDVRGHRNAMIGALSASALFLVSYLVRVSLEGTHVFPGTGWVRVLYLTVLFSHMLLAMVVVPMVLYTLYLALRGSFKRHRRWARWTFPVWLYVSLTGIVVYVMLYRLYGS